jgi:DNA-directed RNA polymerase subunit alpha
MDLDLTVRANNCLETAEVSTVAELVTKDEMTLLSVRSFGKTSLTEVKKKLESLGLSLGMQLPEGYEMPEAVAPPLS